MVVQGINIGVGMGSNLDRYKFNFFLLKLVWHEGERVEKPQLTMGREVGKQPLKIGE